MATPHIAGAMALLWNAIPSLRHQLTASRDALNNSAVHISSTQCGDAGPPNNVYGWGRVDIFAAVGGGPIAYAHGYGNCYYDSDAESIAYTRRFYSPTPYSDRNAEPTPTSQRRSPPRVRPTPHPRP